MDLSRRALGGISTAAILTAAGLAACTTTTTNGVTTVTINTKTVDSYAQVGISAVATMLSIAAVASVIGAPAIVIINAASTALAGTLKALDTATSGSLTFTYDGTGAKAAFDSVLADVGTVLTDMQESVAPIEAKLSSADASTVATVINAVATAYNLLQSLISSVSSVKAPATAPMSEAAMFRAVGLPAGH